MRYLLQNICEQSATRQRLARPTKGNYIQ